MKNLTRYLSESPAFRFVLTMGVVDLFGDMAYSGGAGMNGLFLASLGASAAVVSITGGLSEFLNYLTRGVSGYVADRIGRHWLMVFAGYVLNLLAVPALALAGQWQVAAGLILLQGIGRGARKPIVQAMLSYTTGQHGRGWVYGVHTALDHGGRTVGPLVIALVLFMTGEFRTGYAWLLLPAALALISLTAARIGFPVPARLEQHPTATEKGFTRAYWLYLVAGACFAAGLMSFELISFHLSENGVPREVVPLFLALATGVGAVASLGLGKLYDLIGMPVILGAVFLTAMFSPFVFLLPSPSPSSGCYSGALANRPRTCCSRPWSPGFCPKADGTWLSDCITQDTALAGWSALWRRDSSTSDPTLRSWRSLRACRSPPCRYSYSPDGSRECFDAECEIMDSALG